MIIDLEQLANIVAEKVFQRLLSEGLTPGSLVDLRTLPDALRRHAYKAARSGELEASKRGRRWYAKRSDIDAWLSTRTTSTDDDDQIAQWRQAC